MPEMKRVRLPGGQEVDVVGPVSAAEILASQPGPVMPDTRPNPTGRNAGVSTCPDCGREWIVTPYDDCFIPNCSHYAKGTGAGNPHRPCESCGMKHALQCAEVRGG